MVLETIADLNEINPHYRALHSGCAAAGSDDEIKILHISPRVDEVSLAIDSLNLWVDKTAGESKLNLRITE